MTYRILITGERDWANEQQVHDAIGAVIRRINTNDVVVVHGCCPTGADLFAQLFCDKNGIRFERHPADLFGSWPACGPKRNSHMVRLGADICLCFWSGKTERSGTFDCMRKAVKAGIRVLICPKEMV